MNLIQRIRNLYKLSEWQPSNKQIEDLHEEGRKFAPLTQPPRMATIIHLKDGETIINELLNEK
jgi:hypothetical protein